MVILHSFLYVYQRVYHRSRWFPSQKTCSNAARKVWAVSEFLRWSPHKDQTPWCSPFGNEASPLKGPTALYTGSGRANCDSDWFSRSENDKIIQTYRTCAIISVSSRETPQPSLDWSFISQDLLGGTGRWSLNNRQVWAPCGDCQCIQYDVNGTKTLGHIGTFGVILMAWAWAPCILAVLLKL